MLLLSISPSNGFQWLLTSESSQCPAKYYCTLLINLPSLSCSLCSRHQACLLFPGYARHTSASRAFALCCYHWNGFFSRYRFVCMAWFLSSFKSCPNAILFKITNLHTLSHTFPIFLPCFIFLPDTIVWHTIYFTESFVNYLFYSLYILSTYNSAWCIVDPQ